MPDKPDVEKPRDIWRDEIDQATDLGPQGRLVAYLFHRFANASRDDAKCERVWIEVGTGMQLSGMSHSSWYAWTQRLIIAGWLEVTEPGRRGAGSRAARHRLTVPCANCSRAHAAHELRTVGPGMRTYKVRASGPTKSGHPDCRETRPRQDPDYSPPAGRPAGPTALPDDWRPNRQNRQKMAHLQLNAATVDDLFRQWANENSHRRRDWNRTLGGALRAHDGGDDDTVGEPDTAWSGLDLSAAYDPGQASA